MRFNRSRRGAALVEYGLLVGLVAVVAIGAVSTLGLKVDHTFREVGQALSASMTDNGEASPDAPVEITHLAFTMTSGSSGPSTGYRDASLAMAHGSDLVVAQNSELPFLSMYHYASGYDNIYFQLYGDQTDYLKTQAFVLRCDGMEPFSLSTTYVSFSDTAVPGGRTIATWGAATTPFVNGQTYSCEITSD